MLLVFNHLEELDFEQLMAIYVEGNEEHGQELWPKLSYEEQMKRSKQDFRSYLQNVFFSKPGTVYAVWQEGGIYVSALRLEPMRDGLLMEALETLPSQRRKGYASALIRAVQDWLGNGILYSHVSKTNTASLALHAQCGFQRYLDHVVTANRLLQYNSCTFRALLGDVKNNVHLRLYQNETETACGMIQGFWKAHNDWLPTREEAMLDLTAWTAPGHCIYFVDMEEKSIGFVHLGSRGAEMDWLEDLFILPEYQGHGIGGKVITLVEEIVKEYSESLYIEAAIRNYRAIRLYHRAGYNVLNTVTLRKDFQPETHETVQKEQLHGLNFEVRNRKE